VKNVNKEREQHWLAILAISSKMRELAGALRWSDLAQLENTRQQLIKTFFAQPVAVEDAELIREGIHTILDIDQQIISLGKKHRREIGGKLVDFRTRKKAVSAYKTHSR
jgi:hypothetical protein